MWRKRLLALTLLLVIFEFQFLFSQSYSSETQKIKIVTTIFPLTEMARGVSGQLVEVHQLIPTSIEVHNFQLKPGDLKILSEAQIIISVSTQLEPWLSKIENSLDLTKIKKINFFDYLKSINYPGLNPQDPHLWLDLRADGLLIKKIMDELKAIDPSEAETYLRNGEAWQKEFETLDEAFSRTLNTCQQKILLIAGHQAFGYLSSRYGLTQVSLVGQNPEAQPSPKRLLEIINLIKTKKIKTIFYESSTPPAYAETIARETGVKLKSLSTGVHLSSKEIENKISFIDLMKKNLETLKESLNCK